MTALISDADIAVKTAWKIPLDRWTQMPEEDRVWFRVNVAYAGEYELKA